MTWHFTSPDGRATFEWVTDKQGLKLRWRRIGDGPAPAALATQACSNTPESIDLIS